MILNWEINFPGKNLIYLSQSLKYTVLLTNLHRDHIALHWPLFIQGNGIVNKTYRTDKATIRVRTIRPRYRLKFVRSTVWYKYKKK